MRELEGEELQSWLWRRREQIKGENEKNGGERGREREGEVPDFNFFFLFIWMAEI